MKHRGIIQRFLFLINLGLLLVFSCSASPTLSTVNLANVPFNIIDIDSQGPTSIWLKTIGDLNHDGLVDLIAGGNTSGGLVWYENPSWAKHVIDPNAQIRTDGEVDDIDKDGDNDIVVIANYDIRWYEAPNWIIHIVDSGYPLHDVEISDLDGDGDLDLVARNQSGFNDGNGYTLHFYRQENPISWTHRSITIENGEGLKLADIDGDNDDDVVINSFWLENTGDILNGPWTAYQYAKAYGKQSVFVNTGDVNGDGRIDIVLSPAEKEGESGNISWFEAPLDAKAIPWTEHIIDENVEAVHHFVGVADMDNDGDSDVVSAEMVQGDNPDEIKVYLNEGGKGLSWVKQVIATTGSHSMRLLDFDKDSDMDLFGANWQGNLVELYENLLIK
jgi:hypothetical protein